MRAELLLPTRVYRFYRGGALLGRLRGEPEEDIFFPEDWEQDVDRLLQSLNKISVRPGDIVYVPAGMPHAIGGGVLIAELQEPTDFSFLCEWRGFPIRAEDSHLGLGWDVAVQALDLSAHEPARRLPAEARSFFWADRQVEATGRFTVLLVVDGEGRIDRAAAGPGAAFAVPAAVERIRVEGDVRVLRCLAPDPRG